MVIMSRRSALAGIGSALVLAPTRGVAQQLRVTPETDMGPFYPITRAAESDADLTSLRPGGKRAIGNVIEVSGRVLDRRGNPVPFARIELWQANAAGRYAHAGDGNLAAPLDPNFQGFAQLAAARDGSYRYTTIMPGAYPDGDDSPRPPHVHLDIAGANDRLITQMLFPGDPLNEGDDVLRNKDRSRLTARAMGAGAGGVQRFAWDVVLANG